MNKIEHIKKAIDQAQNDLINLTAYKINNEEYNDISWLRSIIQTLDNANELIEILIVEQTTENK